MFKNVTNILKLRSLPKIRHSLSLKSFETEDLFLTQLYVQLQKHSLSTLAGARKWYSKTFYSHFLSVLKSTPMQKDLIQVLEHLKSKNIKLSVFSDFAKIPERLNALNIPTHLFDLFISGETLGHLKPQNIGLQIILDHFNIPAANSLFIGDRYDTDGLCAKSLGAPYLILDQSHSWSETKDLLLTF